MPIPNVARWFVNGSSMKEFTYEGGSKVYNFCPNDYHLESHMANNILFFANNDSHAVDILRRLFAFAIACREEYILHERSEFDDLSTEAFFKERNDRELNTLKRYQAFVNDSKFKPRKVEKNFVTIAAWADNETCF